MDKELFPVYSVMCKKVFLLLQIVIVFVCRNVFCTTSHIWGAVRVKANNSVDVHFTSRCAVSWQRSHHAALVFRRPISTEATNCIWSNEFQLRRRKLHGLGTRLMPCSHSRLGSLGTRLNKITSDWNGSPPCPHWWNWEWTSVNTGANTGVKWAD